MQEGAVTIPRNAIYSLPPAGAALPGSGGGSRYSGHHNNALRGGGGGGYSGGDDDGNVLTNAYDGVVPLAALRAPPPLSSSNYAFPSGGSGGTGTRQETGSSSASISTSASASAFASAQGRNTNASAYTRAGAGTGKPRVGAPAAAPVQPSIDSEAAAETFFRGAPPAPRLDEVTRNTALFLLHHGQGVDGLIGVRWLGCSSGWSGCES